MTVIIDVLAVLFPALFLACAPLLLVTRFLRPKLLPWWAVFLCASGAGWVLLVLSEQFDDLSYERCLEASVFRLESRPEGLTQIVDPDCPFMFVTEVYSYNLELGWLWALVYLSPWLALYGIVQLVRKFVRSAKHR
jgi:hypothetical protein